MANCIITRLRLVPLAACLALGACAPISLDYESQTHVVRRGETLYSIAWHYGVDHRQLARWNALSDPNLIYPGQRLSLRAPQRSRTPQAAAAAPAARRTRESAAPPPSAVAAPPPAWSWPTQGTIVARFGSTEGIASGIAITGSNAQPINTAAAGRIAYVGRGLAGYGQLVIVQHNAEWLSAYGHTERVLVRQGDSVAHGAQIASMGLGPRRQPRLHFEIRRNGVPVDPLTLLPNAR